MNKWFRMISNAKDKSAEIRIDGEIGWDVSAADFRRELANLGPVETILLRINSPGGSVMDGFAIFNALAEHPARITARVDGWAASMASIIAMAADTPLSLPARSVAVTVHFWYLRIFV